jgi:hypothetical protein
MTVRDRKGNYLLSGEVGVLGDPPPTVTKPSTPGTPSTILHRSFWLLPSRVNPWVSSSLSSVALRNRGIPEELNMKRPRMPLALLLSVALSLAACGAPPVAPADLTTGTPAVAATDTTAVTPTDSPTPQPSPTATELPLLDLEIVEWSEFPYAHPADPNNTDTHVEVLIRNPNDVPVRIDQDGVDLRFVNAAGEVVFSNENPFFYVWEGSWMLPGETAALSACVCFSTSGVERQEWDTLSLVVPVATATDITYTRDVEVVLGEWFSLAEAHLGGSGLGAELSLTNTSDQVLESIPLRVLARDATGRYIGIATFGDAVASFTEEVNIQPGDTANGVVVSEIEYFNKPMTYEVNAIGILAKP